MFESFSTLSVSPETTLSMDLSFIILDDLLTTWECKYPHLEHKPTQNYQFTSLWRGKLLPLPLLFYCFLKIISLVWLSWQGDRYGEICPKKRFLRSLQQQRKCIPQAVPPWPYSWGWFSLYGLNSDCDFVVSHAFQIRHQQQATQAIHFIFKVYFRIQREQLILSLKLALPKGFSIEVHLKWI